MKNKLVEKCEQRDGSLVYINHNHKNRIEKINLGNILC